MMKSFRGKLHVGMGIMMSFVLPLFLRAQATDTLARVSVSADPERSAVLVYVNRQYGFRFDLPADWKGYRILTQRWDGTTQDEPRHKEYGPRILIRDPRWTKAQPRQDIPIMIFTLQQWKEDLVVSAAPIGPSELGRNSRYVFALTPRYNFAYPDGYKEVEEIIEKKPLHPF